MNRQQLIDYCLTLPGSYEDYPFDGLTDPGKWTVMRHEANTKSFALIFERAGRLCINLKCDPEVAEWLRLEFADVIPGYHMNKVHWNTILVGGDVPDDELEHMIVESYDLIKPKSTRRAVNPVERRLDNRQDL